jgi:hypothetical protein
VDAVEEQAAQSGAGTAVALGLLLALQIPIMPIVILGPNLPQLFRQFGALPQADLLVPLIMTAPALGIALLAPLAGASLIALGTGGSWLAHWRCSRWRGSCHCCSSACRPSSPRSSPWGSVRPRS